MFLPIGDEPNPRIRPLVNQALIAVNALIFILVSLPLMFQAPDLNDPALADYVTLIGRESGAPLRQLLAQISAYDLFVFKYGFRPGSPTLMTLLGSLFLHAGWLHLIGNMLFLWIFGDNVEALLGRSRYFAVYLLTGVLATLFFAAFQQHSQIPLIGASGAISGVLGCYFVWFPRNRVRVLIVLFWFMDVVLVPARWVLLFYLVIENLLPFVFSARGGGVAHGAHLGGFIGGVIVAYAVDYLRVRRRFISDNETQPSPVPTPTSTRDIFSLLLSRGSLEEAVRLYASMTIAARLSLREDDVFALADWLTIEKRFDTALAILQGFMAMHPHSRFLARAHLRAGYIYLRAKARYSAAAQHFLTVLDVDPEPDVEAAAREGLRQIDNEKLARRLH